MAWLKTAGPYIMQAGSSLMGASAQKKAARAQAKQYKHRKMLARSSSQRDSIADRRDARYVLSRARAVAASQGGAMDDPTMVNVFADIEAEGEYNALSRLFEGEEAAQGDAAAARAARNEGSALQTAGFLQAGASLWDGYNSGSFAKKYK
jgi:hypothetical protein